jgi:hypothetical protein
MASNYESESYMSTPPSSSPPSGRIKVDVIAAASALAGGLDVAWWYRKILKTLPQTDEMNHNPQFGIHFDHTREDG